MSKFNPLSLYKQFFNISLSLRKEMNMDTGSNSKMLMSSFNYFCRNWIRLLISMISIVLLRSSLIFNLKLNGLTKALKKLLQELKKLTIDYLVKLLMKPIQ